MPRFLQRCRMFILISMTNEKDTIVFIDAGYLSLISKFLGKCKHLKFNISKFSEHIANKQDLKLSKTFYYTAPPYQSPVPKSDEITRRSN